MNFAVMASVYMLPSELIHIEKMEEGYNNNIMIAPVSAEPVRKSFAKPSGKSEVKAPTAKTSRKVEKTTHAVVPRHIFPPKPKLDHNPADWVAL